MLDRFLLCSGKLLDLLTTDRSFTRTPKTDHVSNSSTAKKCLALIAFLQDKRKMGQLMDLRGALQYAADGINLMQRDDASLSTVYVVVTAISESLKRSLDASFRRSKRGEWEHTVESLSSFDRALFADAITSSCFFQVHHHFVSNVPPQYRGNFPAFNATAVHPYYIEEKMVKPKFAPRASKAPTQDPFKIHLSKIDDECEESPPDDDVPFSFVTRLPPSSITSSTTSSNKKQSNVTNSAGQSAVADTNEKVETRRRWSQVLNPVQNGIFANSIGLIDAIYPLPIIPSFGSALVVIIILLLEIFVV